MAKFWEKLTGKRKKKHIDEDTVPLPKASTSISTEIEMATEEVTKPLTPLGDFADLDISGSRSRVEPPQLTASCAQSVGRQRDHNEDALFCMTTTLACNNETTPFGLYIVADGMGGHQNGEVASEIALRTMTDHVVGKLFKNIFSTNPHPPDEPLQEILQEGVQKAHNGILDQITGGGTTLTAVIIFGNQMTIAHVGDSRIYSISLNGRLRPLTRDHSLVKRLEELGQLTPEEAAVDPRRNVLYHALGQGAPLEPEIITAPVPKPGFLLVCSDGLWGVITEEKIGEIVRNATNLSVACQEMVDAANEAGGPDNITAILVRLPD